MPASPVRRAAPLVALLLTVLPGTVPAEHLGLGYEDWMDDSWWYFEFSLGG